MHGGEAAGHRLWRREPHPCTAVAVAAPRRVHRGQVAVDAPVARVEEGEDARAVGARLGAEHPRVVVEPGQTSGVVEHGDHVGEGVAEEPGDADDDIDARPAQLVLGDELDAGHPARLLGPHRAHPQEGEDLSDVVAPGAHAGRAPDDEADGGRGGISLDDVAHDDRFSQLLADVPRQPRRDGLRVDRVEVASRRQDVGHATRRRAARAGRYGSSVESREHVVDFVGRLVQGGDEAVAHPTKRPVTAVVAPALPLEGAEGGPVLGLDLVDVVAGGLAVAERGHVALRQAGHGQDEIELGFVPGRAAQHVQAATDLGVLELAQVPVDVQHEVVEGLVTRLLSDTQVSVELGLDEQLPDLAADRGQLGRVERGDGGVLVEEVLQPGQVVVGLGASHRRQEVVDDHGVGPALGLGSLARIVDDKGVHERQIAEGDVGPAVGRQAQPLPRQPFEGSVLAQVDDGVSPPAEVIVEGEVLVGRWEVGRVVDSNRVVAEATRRLYGDEDGAEVDRTVAVGQLGHQGVAVVGDAVDAVAGTPQCVQQTDGAGRCVEGDRIADAALLGGIRREHEGDALVGVVEMPKAGQGGGGSGDPFGAVGHGAVCGDRGAQAIAVVDDLLERERHRDDAAVEFGDGDAHRRVHRCEARVRRRPLGGGTR